MMVIVNDGSKIHFVSAQVKIIEIRPVKIINVYFDRKFRSWNRTFYLCTCQKIKSGNKKWLAKEHGRFENLWLSVHPWF